MAELKARHAHGSSANLDAAIAAGTVDAYDMICLDADTNEPKFGWLDKNGNKVLLKDTKNVERVEALPTENGDENMIYLFENSPYIWDAATSACISIAGGSADLSAIETELAKKVDEEKVNALITEALNKQDTSGEVVEF